jgi:hypothetical protein
MTSHDNREVHQYNQEKQPLGEGIVLQKKQKSNKVFVKKGINVNKTSLEEKYFPKRPWSPLNVGKISNQEKNMAIKDERAESPRKACFRVHIVKSNR